MTQSSFIAAMLLAGFVLFLAAKGRLGTYTAVLWGNTAAPLPQLSGSSPASSPVSSSNWGSQITKNGASVLSTILGF